MWKDMQCPCSVHSVSFLLTPPRISWALTQKVCLFSMNGARRSKCSLWRIPVPLVFARPLQEFVKAGKKLITEGDLEAEFRAQCTPQPNGSEWIATQNHGTPGTRPGWLLLHCARGQIRNFRAWGRVSCGKCVCFAAFHCFPLWHFESNVCWTSWAVQDTRIHYDTLTCAILCQCHGSKMFEDSWISLWQQDRLQGTTVMKGPTNSVVQSSLSWSGRDNWKPMRHHAIISSTLKH